MKRKKILVMAGLCILCISFLAAGCEKKNSAIESGTDLLKSSTAAEIITDSAMDRGETEEIVKTSDDSTVSASPETEPEFLEKMTAVVKEIGEGYLLVSSMTDQFPGAYYVYTEEIDISTVKGGDEVVVLWNGDILETSPAQIYAYAVEIR